MEMYKYPEELEMGSSDENPKADLGTITIPSFAYGKEEKSVQSWVFFKIMLRISNIF